MLNGTSAGGILVAVCALYGRDNGIPVTGTHYFAPALIHPKSVPEKWKPYYKAWEQCKDAAVLDQKAMDFFYGIDLLS